MESITTMPPSKECSVCLEKVTGSLRKEVPCQYCQYAACLTCVKRYMLESPQDAHCMNCKRAWNREFIDSYLSMSFRKNALKTHREAILLDREKARLPLLQPRISAKVRADEMNVQILEGMKAIQDMEKTVAAARQDVYRVQNRQYRLREIAAGRLAPEAENQEAEKKEVRQFTQKCPVDDCRGFLSSQWKCGTCQTYVCHECLVPKGKDRDAAHTCNEDTKATAALIRKETRPCPKCGMGISKVDGCFAQNTPVLLWDGTEKMSQDIAIGDTLIGDDGLPRIVQELCSGDDELYEITQTNGMSYTVNSKHKLALKFSGELTIYKSLDTYKVRWFDVPTLSMKSKTIRFAEGEESKALEMMNEFKKSLSLPDVIELTIDEYLKLPESTTKNLMGFKSTGVHWPKKDLRIDPYLVGLYLGDGIIDGISYAIYPQKDPEILQYLLDWCEQNECEVVHDNAYRFRVRRCGAEQGRLAIQHGATSAECKGCSELRCDLCDLPSKPYHELHKVASKNPLKSALDSYSLLKNKHIPHDFLVNDRQTRLHLLAGLVDTDGYLGNDGKRIQLPQANHTLARQIEFLARSLGFVVSIHTIEKKNITFPGENAKDYSDQLCVNISGEHLSDIPCRVARKKCISSAQNKDGLRTSIQVKPVGRGTYYGWSLDGNKRFVTKDFTTLRNCDQMWCVSCQTPFSWATGRLVFGVVHNPHYYQWMREQNGGEAPRVAGDIPCGGLVNFYTIERGFTQKIYPLSRKREVEAIHRLAAELLDQHLRQFARFDEVPDNGDLGIDYTLKLINEEEWKRKLWQRETKREKSLELRGPLDLLANVCSEVLRRMAEVYQVVTETPEAKKKQFTDLLNQLRTLKKYVNGELAKIGTRYGCMVPAVSEAWRFDMHGGNRGEEVDTRSLRERILVVSEDRLGKLQGTQVTEWETRLKSQCMRIEGEDTNPRYVVEAWQWGGYTEFQRNIIRVLMGEAQVILTATGAAAPMRAAGPMNPAVAAAMGGRAPA